MSKRPVIDLSALTSEAATPMAEATQRSARPLPQIVPQAAPPVDIVAPSTAPHASQSEPAETRPRRRIVKGRPEPVKTENLEGLAFKVSPEFRRRFRRRAADADLKLNELLFEALDAWEQKNKL
jgi:hypothetical protein